MAASAAVGGQAAQLLADMHRIDQAHCRSVAAPWGTIMALMRAPQPPSSIASLPAHLQGEAEAWQARVAEVDERNLALRLAQLDARTDDFSRGIALWLRGQTGPLPALARRSPDARLVRLALGSGCKGDDEACRQPLRDQWLHLEPHNVAAWLAQWEGLRQPNPLRTPAELEQQKDALLAGMAQASTYDDGYTDIAQVVLSQPGPARNGLHAAAEDAAWIGRVAAQPTASFSGWIQHCKPPSAAPGSARAQLCLASAETFWRQPPAHLLQAVVPLALAKNLGAADMGTWPARQLQADAMWGMVGRQFDPTMEHLLSSMACRPNPEVQSYQRQWLREGEGAALRAAMQRQGLDEAVLAAEHRASRAKPASAAR
jgi:hypothetical protein